MTQKQDRFIPLTEDEKVQLSVGETTKSVWHLFEKDEIKAVNTAIACERPLLLTGEPGVGKTQLARAAAKILKRTFVRYTVDSKTESRDLLWHFDAIARLADAQLAQSLGWDQDQCKTELASEKYIRPGPLWWGLNWGTASRQSGASAPVQHEDDANHKNGVVVLIDEIDKAEIDVPNGLLEALGEASFHPDGLPAPVRQQGIPPFIVITSNRERSLPAAFVRRCVVLHMQLPKEDDKLKALLVKRGQKHCSLDIEILKKAADELIKDREDPNPPRPGQAEYLDLLHAIEEQAGGDYSPEQLLDMVSPYLLKKRESI